MEGAPLTQEGICQAYQLIEFLKKEQSMFILKVSPQHSLVVAFRHHSRRYIQKNRLVK